MKITFTLSDLREQMSEMPWEFRPRQAYYLNGEVFSYGLMCYTIRLQVIDSDDGEREELALAKDYDNADITLFPPAYCTAVDEEYSKKIIEELAYWGISIPEELKDSFIEWMEDEYQIDDIDYIFAQVEKFLERYEIVEDTDDEETEEKLQNVREFIELKLLFERPGDYGNALISDKDGTLDEDFEEDSKKIFEEIAKCESWEDLEKLEKDYL